MLWPSDNDDDGTDDSDDIDRNDDEGRADGVQRGLSKCVSTAAELCRTKSRHSANRYASNVFPKTMMMMMMMTMMMAMMMMMMMMMTDDDDGDDIVAGTPFLTRISIPAHNESNPTQAHADPAQLLRLF